MPESSNTRDRAQVNELDLVLGYDDVGRLQVVVDHAAGVQVVQRRQQFQNVGDGRVYWEKSVLLVVAALLERRAADVLHDDKATVDALVIDEVENLHDSRVCDVR